MPENTNPINQICAVMGAALLLYPIINEAAKAIAPELQQLTQREMNSRNLLPEHGKSWQDDDREKKRDEKPWWETYDGDSGKRDSERGDELHGEKREQKKPEHDYRSEIDELKKKIEALEKTKSGMGEDEE